MYNSKLISVVIPCYNEELGLAQMLPDRPFFVDEMIVVDNGSSDSTADIARCYHAIEVHEKIRGYGQACLTGISKAHGDVIIILDGDNSYPLTEIDKLLGCLEEKSCDFVTANRFPLADKKAQPVINQWANRAISFFVRMLFNIKLIDSQSGMMAFRRGLLDKIEISNRGMGFSQEIKIRAFVRRDIHCEEVHIHYRARVGRIKFRKINDSIRNIYSLFCLWKELFVSKVKSKF